MASFIKVEEIFKPNKEKHQQYKNIMISINEFIKTKHLTEDLLKFLNKRVETIGFEDSMVLILIYVIAKYGKPLIKIV